MEKFEELKTLITSIEDDASKFYEKGNKAAGVRLRKGLQEIRTLSQTLRQDVSAKNKTVKTA
jgi:hypothetical protein|tara:strand:- start:285 stop:470 length:186 start_codon:yes stop_codon:yes gene_type:complete